MITYAQEVLAVIWLLRHCWMAILRRERKPVPLPESCETKRDAAVIVDAGLLLADFSCEEILALIKLQQRYQNGGSDRAEVVRRLEFIKAMVVQRKLES